MLALDEFSVISSYGGRRKKVCGSGVPLPAKCYQTRLDATRFDHNQVSSRKFLPTGGVGGEFMENGTYVIALPSVKRDWVRCEIRSQPSQFSEVSSYGAMVHLALEECSRKGSVPAARVINAVGRDARFDHSHVSSPEVFFLRGRQKKVLGRCNSKHAQQQSCRTLRRASWSHGQLQ